MLVEIEWSRHQLGQMRNRSEFRRALNENDGFGKEDFIARAAKLPDLLQPLSPVFAEGCVRRAPDSCSRISRLGNNPNGIHSFKVNEILAMCCVDDLSAAAGEFAQQSVKVTSAVRVQEQFRLFEKKDG